MSDSLSRIGSVPPDERRSEFIPPSVEQTDIGDSRLVELQEQEQLWFSWLTILHHRLNKVRPNDPLRAEGQKVLEIATRRWVDAREALRLHQAAD
jgi:hypothetical protein